MNFSSTPGQERFFRRLLLPFKVYVIVASFWLVYAVSKAHSEHVVLAGLSAYLLIFYAICIPFFTIAAVVQFIAHWRRPALVSISFALAASIILAILWQFIASAVR
jgi:E3 ubiquitin-protein ligase DOA10